MRRGGGGAPLVGPQIRRESRSSLKWERCPAEQITLGDSPVRIVLEPGLEGTPEVAPDDPEIIVRGGTLRVGDRVEPVPGEDDVHPAPLPEAALARADDDRRAPGDGRQAVYVVPLSGRHDWIHSFSGSSDPRPYCVTPPTFLAEMAPSGPRAKKIIGTTSVSRACTRS